MAKRRPFRKFVNAVGGVIVVAVLATAGYFQSLSRWTQKGLTALKEEGVPSSIEEYRQSLPHEGRDGAALYGEFQRILEEGDPSVLVRGPDGTLQFRTDETPRTRAARRAAASGWADFFAAEGRLPSPEELSEVHQLLSTAAYSLTRFGAPITAEDRVDARFNDLMYASRLSSNLARCAVGFGESRQALELEADVMRAWRTALASDCRDPNTIEAASRSLSQMPSLPTLRHMFISQFVSGLWVNRNLDRYLKEWVKPGSPNELDETRRNLMVSRPGEIVRESQYVAAWRELFEKLPEDPDDWRGYLGAVREVEESRPKQDDLSPWTGIHELPKLIGFWAERLADRRMSAVSVAILDHRAKHGSLPNELPALGVQSIDPFNGKPFGYKRHEEGFILSSQGAAPEEGGRSFNRSSFVRLGYNDPLAGFALAQLYP